MENILNKALSEVLTPLYSEELRDAFDTGYKFTPEFDNNMRELIRKTDRPVTRYIGYMAAAAVAVIAIGSAIIVPSIMNSEVDVKQPEDTTASVSASTTVPPVTTSQTTSETTRDLNSGIPSVDGDDDAVIVNPVPSVVDSTDTDIPDTVEIVVSDTTTSTSDTTGPAPVDNSGEAEIVIKVDDVEVPNGGDDAAVVVDTSSDIEELDTEVVDEAAIDSEGAVIDGEDDIALVDGSGDYPIEDVVKIEVNNGDTLVDAMRKIIPGLDFNDLWATNATYTPAGTQFRSENLNFWRSEYWFIQDFVHGLGSAVADNTDHPQYESVNKLHLYIKDKQIKVTDYSDYGQNASAWLHYSQYFNIKEGEEPIDDADDTVSDDIGADTNPIMYLTIDSTGRVEVQQSYVVVDNNENKNYLYQLEHTRFYVDTEMVNELFARLEAIHLSEDEQTVGDIADNIFITTGNISQAYVDVHDIYDTDLYHVKVGYDFIAGLLDNHRSDKLTKVKSDMLSDQEEPNGEIRIEFYTNSCAHLKLYLSVNGKCYIADEYKAYRFDISQADFENALDAVGKANNFIIPRYSTLDEYLADKNFRSLSYVNFRGIKDGKAGWLQVYDKTELNTVFELLKAEFAGAEYIKGNTTYDRGGLLYDLTAQVDGYSFTLQFNKNDVVNIRAGNNSNHFIMREGAIERLKALLAECTDARFEPDKDEDRGELEDDVEEEEEVLDVAAEEDDEPDEPDEPDADKNPVT